MRNNLGGAWQKLGKYNQALEYYQKALANDLQTYGADHPMVAIAWNNLGGAWYALASV